jgi:hypothetical protein
MPMLSTDEERRFVELNLHHSVTHFCCEDLALVFNLDYTSPAELPRLLAEADKVLWVTNGRAKALMNSVQAIAPMTNTNSVLGFLDEVSTRSGVDRMASNSIDALAILRALEV